MKFTQRQIELQKRIVDGESVPYSRLPKSFVESFVSEGLLSVIHHGTKRSLFTTNPVAFARALAKYDEALTDLEAAARLLAGDNSRAAQAALSGNSKTRSKRSTPGFLVNSYAQIDCRLCGRPFIIDPREGSAVYIADWESFILPATTLVIGIENMENFLKIREQESLFAGVMKPDETEVLFVARYAFSSDLMKWLASIPNRYLHFGDFDLAGIDIFLKQFKPHVGERGSFLIPPDIELRLMQGSRKRYDDQYQKYSSLTTADDAFNRLITLIHKYRRTYDQEGYILKKIR